MHNPCYCEAEQGGHARNETHVDFSKNGAQGFSQKYKDVFKAGVATKEQYEVALRGY